MFTRRLALAFFLVAAVCSLPAQTYTYSNLHSFNGVDGHVPANVIQASDGNLYGTSDSGGSASDGNVFRATLAGTVSNLYSFCAASSSCLDGKFPQSSVIQGTDGNFYGTTDQGGAYANGSVFTITPKGGLTTLYSFCSGGGGCADGSGPNAVVQGNDGNFYGTTHSGGAYGNGAIFKITSSGESTIYSFCKSSGTGACTDGSSPVGALVQGNDGNFYGVTGQGGANETSSGGAGTVFKVSPAGALTTLYSFCAQGGSNCTDGQSPNSGLTQGSNGDFYGVTPSGGTAGGGTAFSISSAGSLSTLYNFCSVGLCTDGIGPFGPLFLASDGNYYGVAGGGTNANGVFFQLTPAGAESVIYPFCSVGGSSCTDGELLEYGVVQGSDGSFYGTTGAGGTDGAGVLYKVAASPAEKPPVQLSLSSGSVVSGSEFTLTYLVSNAYSDTLKYCYAANTAGNLGWSGATAGSATTQDVALMAPAAAGSYSYSLTCGGQETGIATLTVTAASTATTLSASPNPAQAGQTVTLTATVTKTAGSGEPTGSVTFYYGTTSIGKGTLNGSGVAKLTASTATIPPGSYPLTATYGGDSGDKSSTSSSYTVTLDKAVTSTTVTASPNPVTPPATVKLTATVKRTASGATGVPSGSVTFYSGTLALGNGTLNGSGMATLSASTSGLAAGSYPVTAKYAGDGSDVASTSPAITVMVK